MVADKWYEVGRLWEEDHGLLDEEQVTQWELDNPRVRALQGPSLAANRSLLSVMISSCHQLCSLRN